MSYSLRAGLTYCTIDGVALFLDLPGDRYFRLPETLNTTFLNHAAGIPLDEPSLAALIIAKVLEPSENLRAIGPVAHPLPSYRSPAIASGGFRLPDVARVMMTQRRIERRLHETSLQAIVHLLRKSRDTCTCATFDADSRAARAVRAFEFARLLRSAANRCLPRSIALAMCLAREGVRADVVLAVKLAPFAAHCWTQIGEVVLNDTAEETARYTPILVV